MNSKLYLVTITTQTTKELQVVGQSQDDVEAKIILEDGESIKDIQENGDVIL